MAFQQLLFPIMTASGPQRVYPIVKNPEEASALDGRWVPRFCAFIHFIPPFSTWAPSEDISCMCRLQDDNYSPTSITVGHPEAARTFHSL